VLTEAYVSRILFSDGEVGEDLTATGVEFIHGGKTYMVHALNEIVLSAGQVSQFSPKYAFVSPSVQP